VTTEKAILSLSCIPPSFFVIEKGWPFFSHKLEVRIIVVKHGDGPGKDVSSEQGGPALPTQRDLPQMHPDACEGLGTLLLHGSPFPSTLWAGLLGLGSQGHGPLMAANIGELHLE